MNQGAILRFFREDHRKLKQTIAKLTESQMINDIVMGDWSVKDIIAHISAWNLEIAKSIDDVLDKKAPWYLNKGETAFNIAEVEKRRKRSLVETLEEWEKSFDVLIRRIEDITVDEWNIETGLTWADGSAVTIESLFGYRYKEEGHEGGHALQIREHYNL
ncbi:MAG: DinB family protein [Candidatus Thorarchaeota archaeon]